MCTKNKYYKQLKILKNSDYKTSKKLKTTLQNTYLKHQIIKTKIQHKQT